MLSSTNRRRAWAGLFCTVLLGCAAAEARVITVCWDGSGDFRTIQEGIKAAETGDVVEVCDGTYTGPGNRNLSFNGKAITVRSANGFKACTIDCELAGPAFVFTRGETRAARVSGFLIANGQQVQGGAIYCVGSSPTIDGCMIVNSFAGYYGGGIGCADGAAPLIVGCTISGCMAGTGGGIYSLGSRPEIVECLIEENRTDLFGGAGIGAADGSDIHVIRCRIEENQAGGFAGNGAGVLVSGSSGIIADCMIADNQATNVGGGISCAIQSEPTIRNCTLTVNSAASTGGGIYAGDGSPRITNSIVWGNYGNQIYATSGAPVVEYSDVEGGWSGVGNIDADPLFVDPNHGNYHLRAGSPGVDTGDPQFVPNPGETDIDLQYRLWDGDGNGTWRVDMGADEFGSFVFGDMDCDGKLTFGDINPFVLALTDPAGYAQQHPKCNRNLADINEDGKVDFGDINPFVALLTE